MTEDSDKLDELLERGYRYAMSLTHRPHEAEDLLQEACTAMIARNAPWQRGYLFKTLRNQFIDRLRKQQRKTEMQDMLNHHRQQQADTLERRDDPAPQFASWEAVEFALGKLSPAQRETLYLACIEQYTASEIAEMTDKPRGTILSLLHRARRKLQDELTCHDVERPQ